MPTWRDQGFTEVRTEDYEKKYGVLGTSETVVVKKKLRTYTNPHTGQVKKVNYAADMRNALIENSACAKKNSYGVAKDGKKHMISDKKRAYSRGWLARRASEGYMWKMSHEK